MDVLFQRTTNRKWPIGIKWPCEWWRHVTLKVLWGSTVGYPSYSLASCLWWAVNGRLCTSFVCRCDSGVGRPREARSWAREKVSPARTRVDAVADTAALMLTVLPRPQETRTRSARNRGETWCWGEVFWWDYLWTLDLSLWVCACMTPQTVLI